MFHQTAKNIYDRKVLRPLAEETKGAGDCPQGWETEVVWVDFPVED